MSSSDIAIALLIAFAAIFTILYYRVVKIKREHTKRLIRPLARLPGHFWDLVRQGFQRLYRSYHAKFKHKVEFDTSTETLILTTNKTVASFESTLELEQDLSSSQDDESCSGSDSSSLSSYNSPSRDLNYVLLSHTRPSLHDRVVSWACDLFITHFGDVDSETSY